jgi:hypothetical protein
LPEGTLTTSRRVRGQTARKPQQPALPGRPWVRTALPDLSEVAARVRRECAAQGIPETVEDPAVLSRIVTLAYVGLAMPSKTP